MGGLGFKEFISIYIYMVTPPYDPARVCFLRKNHGFTHIFDGRVLGYFIFLFL